MTATETKWRQRVASWRASGETAAVFSARHEFAAASLRWWASRLGRETAPLAPVIRLAQVVRPPEPPVSRLVHGGGVVVELLDARARVTVEPGVERETLALVFELLGVRGAR